VGRGLILCMNTHTTKNVPPTTVGAIVHLTIADLLRRTRTPSLHEVKGAVEVRTQGIGDRSHVRAVRQRVLGLTSLYFWHLALDETWKFIGSELDLGVGHIDLAFEQRSRILIDEVKSGLDARLALGTATHQQTDRYVADGRELHGRGFLGVRVLSLTDPDRSLLKSDVGVSQLLTETPYHPWSNN
jgi:hypothetical protein